MLTSAILWATREDHLDDIKIPYLWSDELLLRHLIAALDEWCKDTGCLRDFTTEAICKIPILCNQWIYATDSRITKIIEGYLTTAARRVVVKTYDELNEIEPTWRTDTGAPYFLIPDYNQNYLRAVPYFPNTQGYWTGAFSFTTGTNTVGQTGALFSNLLVAGDKVVVSGTTLNGTTAVPKTFTVLTVLSDSFTTVEAISTETASAGIIQKVNDSLWLTVSRRPLVPLTLAAWNTQSPEIDADDHVNLIDGILKKAYLKQDSQCFDKEKAEYHRGLFEQSKAKALAEADWSRTGTLQARPHRGAL
jgi:hypothetical protein